MRRILGLILIFIALITCRKDPVLISTEFKVDIDYTDSMKILVYAKTTSNDTVELAQYYYHDTAVLVDRMKTNHRKTWYYFKPGDKYAWRSCDTLFDIDNPKTFYVTTYYNEYYSNGYLYKKNGNYKVFRDTGISNNVNLEFSDYRYENGNLISVVNGPSYFKCWSTYQYSNDVAEYCKNKMLDNFTGKVSVYLPKSYNPGCYYGHESSSPRYEYQYTIDGPYVTSETSIEINEWYDKNREIQSRKATLTRFYYHQK